MSTSRGKAIWREFDKLAFLASVILIVIVAAIHFGIGAFDIAPEVKEFVQAIIVNIMPVLLLFMLSYAFFRRIQTLRSELETEELASKVALKVIEALREIPAPLEDVQTPDEAPAAKEPAISTEISSYRCTWVMCP